MKKSSYTVVESSAGMVTYNEKDGETVYIRVTRPQPHSYDAKLSGIISLGDAKLLRDELSEVLKELEQSEV